MGQVQVGVLGGPQVQHEGAPLAFPTRKALAPLVYLVVEGGQQPREKLATLLWRHVRRGLVLQFPVYLAARVLAPRRAPDR
jgi:hypothetical protein